MDRETQKRPTPMRYQQPGRYFEDWVLHDTQEDVDYVPQTHLRIWYNNERGVYSTHHHSAMEIMVCMENQSVVIANGETYRLNVGDILIIPPHMLHKLIFEDFGVRFIYLIDVEILKCYQDFKVIDPVFMQPFHCTAATHPQIYQDLYDSLIQMTDVYFENNAFWEMRIYAIILSAISLIGRYHFTRNAQNDSAASEAKQWEYYGKFSSLLNYIDANYNQDLTLEQAAQYIGFSKYHFARLFKTYTNTTFYNYLCHKRMQVAQSLLSTDTPITNIAIQTGFNNLTSFCRCFRKFTNCSPTEYRLRLSEVN